MRATMLIRNMRPTLSTYGPRRGTEIVGEQISHPPGAIPLETVEIVADRVEGALAGAHIDGLMHDVLADAAEPELLEALLHDSDIDIGQRSRREVVLTGERLHEDGSAQHFVVAESVGPFRA